MTHIIACIDTSNSAHGVCSASGWISQRLDVPVLALHVLERVASDAMGDLTGAIGLGAREELLFELAELDHQRSKLAMAQGKIMLEAACKEIITAGAVQVNPLQLHSTLPEALMDQAPDTRVIVLGRQGKTHEAASDSVGSQLETVVRLSEHPVLVIPKEFTQPTRAVIAYDASATAQRMLTRLAASPILQGLDIELLMAASDSPEHHAQLRAAQAQLSEAGYTATTSLEADEALSVLKSVSADPATLLCMGAFGHSRIREFLIGSTTNETLRQAKSSVLLIR